eukprot:m.4348 g.4348  ORF g.4348 m.4348 type:complete len:246 (+) comp4469_c0_seq1:16-753(+)
MMVSRGGMAGDLWATGSSSKVPAPLPNITLDDLDAEEFQEVPFVLTSPRSLAICEQLHVQPIALLPPSARRQSHTQVSLVSEHERQRLLHFARIQRHQLMRAQQWSNPSTSAQRCDRQQHTATHNGKMKPSKQSSKPLRPLTVNDMPPRAIRQLHAEGNACVPILTYHDRASLRQEKEANKRHQRQQRQSVKAQTRLESATLQRHEVQHLRAMRRHIERRTGIGSVRNHLTFVSLSGDPHHAFQQ